MVEHAPDPELSADIERSRQRLADDTEPIQLSNEFAQVIVKKVYTKKGERLQIESPKLDYSIRIDAIGLESLTWQDEELFSELLETPYGPE